MPDPIENLVPAPTPEEIDRHYAACLDSVAAIEAAKLAGDDACVARNIEHLELMVAKDFWGPSHDLSVLEAAIENAE
jgi:hypothetical protein